MARVVGSKRSDEIAEKAEVTLGILEAVGRGPRVSQRSMARDLNVALGLVNAYLRRCVRKGLIKMQEVPKGRFAYYLTPKGFAEKSLLTAEYLSGSFDFFRSARADYNALIALARANGWSRLALIGASDAAEIAAICATEEPVEICAVVAPGLERNRFVGLPVYGDAAAVRPLADAVLLTELRALDEAYASAVAVFGAERVLVPAFLRRALSTPQASGEPDAP